jgi:two-component system sensor histidine kinase/response regulator
MPHTLLVVEDDLDVRENITEILSENYYRVITSSNGREAIKLLITESPDLIISDIMMPKMNGFELLEFVHASKNLAHIPFIFLTAKSSIQEMKSGMMKGADNYLTKPFKANDLLDVVEMKLKRTEHIKNQLAEIRENIALSVPHEFRTPLLPIIGYSGMMMEDAKNLTSKEIEEMSAAILSSALRLRTSVEKFILYSGLQYDLNYLKNNSSLISNVVERIEDMIMETVRKENKYTSGEVGIETEIEKGRIMIDEAYYAICIKELVENAFKFSNPNTTVKITGKTKTHYYELSFENEGTWLTNDQIKGINVFNKQFDPTMPGSGLGIPIVKKISEYFKCELTITSIPKSITTVIIKIPKAKDYLPNYREVRNAN